LLADSALQTVVTQIDGTEVKTLDQDDNVANFVTGDNIVLSDEAGGIKIATAEDVTFTSINSDSLAITGGPTLNSDGIDMGGDTITNVGAPVNGGDALNLDYFNENRTRYYSVNDNGTVQGNYENDGATGINALAAGTNATASGQRGIAVGDRASAVGNETTSVGHRAGAGSTSSFSTFVGNHTGAGSSGFFNVALGHTAGESTNGFGNTYIGSQSGRQVEGDFNVALGFGAGPADGIADNGEGAIPVISATANRTVSIGRSANAAKDDSIAIGTESKATEASAIAMGNNATASGEDALAIGTGAIASGEQSISIGFGNDVSGDRSGAFGDPNIITGTDSYAVGNDNEIDADEAGAFGNRNVLAATAEGSRIVGNDNDIDVADAFVMGNGADVTEEGGVALGSGSVADTGAGIQGYNPVTGAADGLDAAIVATESTTGAVAVGDADGGVFRQITGVAAGTEDSDAVNVSQLKALGGTPLTFAGDTGVDVDRQLGETFNIIGGADASGNTNISTVADGTDTLEIVMTDQPTFGNVTVNTTGGDTINGLSNLTFDPDDFASGQAATEDQLKQVSDIANTGWNLSAQDELAENIAPGDEVNLRNTDGNLVITQATDNGREEVTFNLDDDVEVTNSLTVGSVVTDATTNDITGLSNLDLDDPSFATVGRAASEEQLDLVTSDLRGLGLDFAGDSGTDVHRDLGETLNIIGGATDLTDNNIGVVANGDDTLEIKLAKNLTGLEEVSITGGPTLTGGGIDMNNTTISNLSDGVNANDAVNLSQLEDAAAASKTEVEAGTNVASVDQTTGADGQDIYTVNADGTTVSAGTGVDVTPTGPDANNITDYEVALNQDTQDSLLLADSALQTVVTQIDGTEVKTLDQDDNVANFVTGDNIVLTDEAGGIKIATAEDVTFTSINSDSLAITGGPTLTGGGIDMNNTTISNLADGVNANDAVNLSQLEGAAAASKTEVEAGTNVASVDQTTGADGQAIYTVNADGTTVSAGTGMDVVATGPDANNVTDYEVALNQDTQDSLLLADSALQTVVTQIDGTEVKTLDQDDNVANFVTGDNIVLSDEAGGIKIATAEDVTFTSINSDSLAITGGPTLTGGGIDMNNTTISNLADGVNANDAVNLSQLEGAAAASKTEVEAGTNVASVDQTTGADGQDIYTVNADGTTVTAGTGVTVTDTDAGGNVTDYEVALNQ
ncbi:hypothetical protein, partial [Vreelandella alkaliphila]